ncbi:MAG: 16S rRNA (guanine(966)-N(2))-methyltransferase RsmD [bacterium]
MKIIAGSARGRKIFSVAKNTPIKPISGRMRQSVFDILRPRVTASRFLDLFAGTGAVGLEALSRGAHSVIFVEKEKMCVKVIEKNLANLGFTDKARVLRADVMSGVEWLIHHSGYEGYDIIFMGPPYRDAQKNTLTLTSGVLGSIAACRVLAPSGVIAAQHHVRETVAVPAGLDYFGREKYGDTYVDFFRRRKTEKPEVRSQK